MQCYFKIKNYFKFYNEMAKRGSDNLRSYQSEIRQDSSNRALPNVYKGKEVFLLILDESFLPQFLEWSSEIGMSDLLLFLLETDSFRFKVDPTVVAKSFDRLISSYFGEGRPALGLLNPNYISTIYEMHRMRLPWPSILSRACSFIWDFLLNKSLSIYQCRTWGSIKKMILGGVKIELLNVLNDRNNRSYLEEYFIEDMSSLHALYTWSEVRNILKMMDKYKTKPKNQTIKSRNNIGNNQNDSTSQKENKGVSALLQRYFFSAQSKASVPPLSASPSENNNNKTVNIYNLGNSSNSTINNNASNEKSGNKNNGNEDLDKDAIVFVNPNAVGHSGGQISRDLWERERRISTTTFPSASIPSSARTISIETATVKSAALPPPGPSDADLAAGQEYAEPYTALKSAIKAARVLYSKYFTVNTNTPSGMRALRTSNRPAHNPQSSSTPLSASANTPSRPSTPTPGSPLASSSRQNTPRSRGNSKGEPSGLPNDRHAAVSVGDAAPPVPNGGGVHKGAAPLNPASRVSESTRLELASTLEMASSVSDVGSMEVGYARTCLGRLVRLIHSIERQTFQTLQVGDGSVCVWKVRG